MAGDGKSIRDDAAHEKRIDHGGVFRDRIRIHTASSGTQSISVLDLLLDEKVKKDMDRLNEILTGNR